MQTIKLTLPNPHAGRTQGGQVRILSEMKRYNVLNCGRRFGKTDFAQIAISKPILDGYPVGWFAPTYKYLTEAWSEITRIYAPIIKRSNNTDKIIEFVTGGTLEGWTLDKEGAGRSRKYKRVVIDEAAKAKNLWDVFNFDIRATLLDYKGDAIFASTPKGLNDFHKIWQAAGEGGDWARWQMATSENPYISLDEIQSMRESMPAAVARQELDAEFLEDGSFFQGVDKVCTIEAPDIRENHAGHRLVAGLDWALSNDYTVLRIGCCDCARYVDGYRANRLDFSVQRLAIRDKLKYWYGCSVLPERNSIGEPNIEMLRSDGVSILPGPDGYGGFQTTGTTKPELIHRLAVAIERSDITLAKEDADELRSYEVQFTSGGHPQFSAPDGMHDDRVIANALMWWAMSYAVPLPKDQPEQVSKWLNADNEDEQGWTRRY